MSQTAVLLCECFTFLLVFIHSGQNRWESWTSFAKGKWNYNLTDVNHCLAISKSLFVESQIFIEGNCDGRESTKPTYVTISSKNIRPLCWQTVNESSIKSDVMMTGHITNTHECNNHIELTEIGSTTSKDGIYTLLRQIGNSISPLSTVINMEIKGRYNYLSAIDWSLFSFYNIVHIFDVVFGIVWLSALYMQWQHVINIQFWIEAIIILGMLIYLTFYEGFQNINHIGNHLYGGVLIAEWFEYAKRTLARLLVIWAILQNG